MTILIVVLLFAREYHSVNTAKQTDLMSFSSWQAEHYSV